MSMYFRYFLIFCSWKGAEHEQENRPLNYSVWFRSHLPEERHQDTETNINASNDSSNTLHPVESTQTKRKESNLSSESGSSHETEQNNANSSTLQRRFFNFVNVFSLFRKYFPLEKCGALHLNKLESPSPTDALCQVWLKLA